MQLPNDVKQFISFGIFLIAIVIVLLLIYFGYFLYKEYKAVYGENPPVDDTIGDSDLGLPILESKLRRFSTFNDVYMAQVKIIATPDINKYFLFLKYDLNNLPISLETHKEDMIKLQKKMQEDKEIADSKFVSPFDKVVNILDEFESAGTGNKTSGPVDEWKFDPNLKRISNKTDALFGLSGNKINFVNPERRGSNAGSGGSSSGSGGTGGGLDEVTQDDINQLLSFIDRLRLDMNLKDVIDLEVNNRLVTIKLPIKVIERDDSSVLMRFDPTDLTNTIDTDLIRSFDLRIFDDKALFSLAGSDSNRQFTIVLK
jgi:hypothetical protein